MMGDGFQRLVSKQKKQCHSMNHLRKGKDPKEELQVLISNLEQKFGRGCFRVPIPAQRSDEKVL